MDSHIVHQMDREIRSQQAKLAKVCMHVYIFLWRRMTDKDTFQIPQLRVPFFKVTSSMDDIKMQHKVLSILQDMIDDGEDEKQ